MNVFITGTLVLGSKLYSQCLRDLLRLSLACKRKCLALTVTVDDSQAGLLARKLVSAIAVTPVVRDRFLAVPQADTILVYEEEPDKDYAFEELVYDSHKEGADVYVRKPPEPETARPVAPAEEPYNDFRRAFELIERRIRPIPTRGPQVWREVEIRPNGGRPWFYL